MSLLDLPAPVALLLVAVLHFVPDEDKPWQCVAALLDAVPAGSWLLISHVTGEFSAQGAAGAAAEYRTVTPGSTMHTTVLAPLRPSAIRPWTPQHNGLQRPKPGTSRGKARTARQPHKRS